MSEYNIQKFKIGKCLFFNIYIQYSFHKVVHFICNVFFHEVVHNIFLSLTTDANISLRLASFCIPVYKHSLPA